MRRWRVSTTTTTAPARVLVAGHDRAPRTATRPRRWLDDAKGAATTTGTDERGDDAAACIARRARRTVLTSTTTRRVVSTKFR
jgi:hypothetical protein